MDEARSLAKAAFHLASSDTMVKAHAAGKQSLCRGDSESVRTCVMMFELGLKTQSEVLRARVHRYQRSVAAGLCDRALADYGHWLEKLSDAANDMARETIRNAGDAVAMAQVIDAEAQARAEIESFAGPNGDLVGGLAPCSG